MSMKRADNEAQTESSDLNSDVRDARKRRRFRAPLNRPASHPEVDLKLEKSDEPSTKRDSCLRKEYANHVRDIHWHLHAGNLVDQRQMQMRYDSQLGAQFHLNVIGARDPHRLET